MMSALSEWTTIVSLQACRVMHDEQLRAKVTAVA